MKFFIEGQFKPFFILFFITCNLILKLCRWIFTFLTLLTHNYEVLYLIGIIFLEGKIICNIFEYKPSFVLKEITSNNYKKNKKHKETKNRHTLFGACVVIPLSKRI